MWHILASGLYRTTPDLALIELVRKGRISGIDAYHQANNKAKFREMVEDPGAIVWRDY
jgi:hypothetical protein